MSKQFNKKEILKAVQLTAVNAAAGIFKPSNITYLNTTATPLMEYYNVSMLEAVIISLFMDIELKEESMTHEKLLGFIGNEIIHFPEFITICEELVKKRMLIYTSNNYNWFKKKSGYRSYRIHFNIIKEIFDEKAERHVNTGMATHFYEMLDELNELFMLCANRHISSHMLFDEVYNSIFNSTQISESKWLMDLRDCNKTDLAILVYLTNDYLKGHTEIDLDILLRDLFERTRDRIQYKDQFYQGRNYLLKNNLVSLGDKSGIQFTNVIQLTEIAKEGLVKQTELTSKTRFLSSIGSIIPCEKINEERLFYNQEEEIQINTIKCALDINTYDDLKTNLQANNLGTGIICLFYGNPGTGKTASVLQIAKEVKRDVLMVNIESIHSKWVGESEKNIAKIFEEYKSLKSVSSNTPILLFNEGDAIIGRRVNVNSVVDQMNNSIQNILLQKLEDFDGILIITSNLTKNFDEAFERRFLYKVKFNKPSYDIKGKILANVFKNFDLSREDLCKLANIELTGANIANIKKKVIVDSLIKKNHDVKSNIYSMALLEASPFSKSNKIGFTFKNDYYEDNIRF